MPTPALRIRNVTKRFAELVAVDSMSFDIKPREFVSVIGPSGCGKSTLFNIIGGFIAGYEGEVLVHGTASDRRRSIGMVFQVSRNCSCSGMLNCAKFGTRPRVTSRSTRSASSKTRNT